MTNSPSPSTSVVNRNLTRRYRRRNLHRMNPDLLSPNELEQWSLQELVGRVSRNHHHRHHAVVNRIYGNNDTTRITDSSMPRLPPTFPRLGALHELEYPASASASVSTPNIGSRSRLVSVLQEALEISNSIILDDSNKNSNDTDYTTDMEKIFHRT